MIAFFVVSMATEKDSDCLTICKLSRFPSSPPKAAEAAQMLQQAQEHRLLVLGWALAQWQGNTHPSSGGSVPVPYAFRAPWAAPLGLPPGTQAVPHCTQPLLAFLCPSISKADNDE